MVNFWMGLRGAVAMIGIGACCFGLLVLFAGALHAH